MMVATPAPTSGSRALGSGVRPAVGAALLLLAVVELGILLFYIPGGVPDDSFITYRYARNLAAGFGLSWNVGEPPVEGYSSLGWLVLIAAGHAFTGASFESIGYWGGVAGAFVLLLGTWRIAIRVIGQQNRWLASLAPVVLGASPLIARHAVSGMDTMLTALFYMALTLTWTGAKSVHSPSRYAAAVALLSFLGVIIRPDSPVFSVSGSMVAVLLAGADRSGKLRALLLFAVTFALCLGVYLIWKQDTFGAIVPLPALLKFSPRNLYHQGDVFRLMTTVWVGFVGYLSPFMILGLASALALGMRLPPVAWSVAAGTLATMAYLLTAVPIMNFEWRLQTPLLAPVVAVSVGLAVIALAKAGENGGRWTVRMVLLVGLGGLVLHGISYAHDIRNSARELMQASRRYEMLGRALSAVPGTTIVYSEAGRIPFYSGARHIDVAGLTDRFVAVHRRSGDIDAVFETYLIEQVELPDIIFEPAPEYWWSGLRYLPRLQPEYETVKTGDFIINLRRHSKRYDALHSALALPPSPDS